MPKFLKFSILGLAMVFAFTVLFAIHAQAQTTYTESVLASFSTAGSGAYLQNPIQASDGNYYATTSVGGANSKGSVVMITPGGTVTLLYSFASSGPNGDYPSSGLIQGRDGYLYGTTTSAGGGNKGTLYRLTLGAPATFTLLHSFAGGTTDGNEPEGSLVQGTDGNLYGVTVSGGTGELGTVFNISTVSPYPVTLLHSFVGGTLDGSQPYAGLVQGTDGNFYGTTTAGGVKGDGTVFSINSTGTTFTLLHSFSTATTDGNQPYSGLVQGTDGNFYGTTYVGGAKKDGTVFSINSTGSTFSLLHSFTGATTDGKEPFATLVQGSDGKLYGTTEIGGANSDGTAFAVSLSGAFTQAHSFTGSPADGTEAYGGLVQGDDGSFYGISYAGGANNRGAVYKIAASPTLAGPVQLTAPASVPTGTAFALSYLVTNATSDTMQQCFATNSAGDTTGWTGVETAATTATDVMLTASSTPGTYRYTLTCGGVETGTVNVVVAALPALTFTSVTHNFGSSTVGTAATLYGIQIKNTSAMAYPYSLVFTPANGFTSATNCPASIAAGAVCELVFYFTPAAAGTVTDSWSLTPESGFAYSPSNGGTLTGAGTAVAGATLTTAEHNFGALTVGTTSPIYGVVLTNSTAASISLSYSTVTSPFIVSGDNCGATLAAGASCNLQYEFQPTATGTTQQVYGIKANGGAVPITTGNPAIPVTGVTLIGAGQ
jgi:uncharacterized repeat protein (TIGR03803 family)